MRLLSLDMVGKAYMKKEYYVDNINMHDIIQIEKNLYKLYQDVIHNFENSFSSYNCHIEINDCWTADYSGNATNIRPKFEKEYVYWICYEVLYNGKPITYDDEDSPITRSYGVLEISKVMKRFKQKFIVKVCDETEDVKEELMEDLNKIRQVIF